MNIEKNGTNNNTDNKEENEMMHDNNWKEYFARRMSDLTGHTVCSEHIHSDEGGWHYYITAKTLVSKHPLLMCHYRGPLFVVIPTEEYNMLERGELNPTEYIDQSNWSYGYLWGGGSMVGGSFWQPLEATTGIHDKEKIYRYLQLLMCRTHKHSCGYMPCDEKCMKCSIERCPFSKLAEKNEGGNWENEVQEHDYRVDLFHAVARRVDPFMGIKLRGLLSHDGDTALLVPNYERDTCTLYLPVTLTNDILYNPGARDWDEIASKFTIEIGVFGWDDSRMVISADGEMAPADMCREFWSKHGGIKSWNMDNSDEEMAADCGNETVAEPEKPKNLFQVIKSVFKRKVG